MVEIVLLISGIVLGFFISQYSYISASNHHKNLIEKLMYPAKEDEIPEEDPKESLDQNDWDWNGYDNYVTNLGEPEEDEELEAYDKNKN